MSLKMTKSLYVALDITATGAKTPVLLNESPLMGGGGLGGASGGNRNAYLVLDNAIGGSGSIKLQGHDGIDLPADADAGWFDLTPAILAAGPLRREVNLARWVRFNVGVAGTGTLTAHLEGVQ